MQLSTRLFNSARIKLTSSYVLIILLIIILFSTILYQGAVMELRRSLRTQALRFVPRFDRLVPMSVETEPDEEVYTAARNRLLVQLAAVDTIIFIFASGAAYILAGRTLEPIEAAMARQKQFVSDASHELRTPLTAMRTEIEVMLREKKIEHADARKILTSNLEEIDKMRALSDHLLKLSSLDNSEHLLTLETVSLTQALESAIKNVTHLATLKQITIDKVGMDASYAVQGNAVSLVELFTILLDNAIKYSHDQDRITVAVNAQKKNIKVEIVDRGVGIRATEIPYIFNRFYRADSSRNKKQVDGFGLGLAIAKKIVVQNRGRIIVTSEVGRGTTFSVILNT